MARDFQVPATAVARMFMAILANRDPRLWEIFKPKFIVGATASRAATPFAGFGTIGEEVMLNPQPLPPAELFAVSIADAHISEIVAVDRAAALFGGEAGKRASGRSLAALDAIEELCPRPPKWPKVWPPGPPPPWRGDEEMTQTELFLFGLRFLAAADAVEQPEVQDALGRVGEKALNLALQQQVG